MSKPTGPQKTMLQRLKTAEDAGQQLRFNGKARVMFDRMRAAGLVDFKLDLRIRSHGGSFLIEPRLTDKGRLIASEVGPMP